MSITIRIASVAAIVDRRNTRVWLEHAPQPPKTLGAIWAELIVQQRAWLRIGDTTDKRGRALFADRGGLKYQQ